MSSFVAYPSSLSSKPTVYGSPRSFSVTIWFSSMRSRSIVSSYVSLHVRFYQQLATTLLTTHPSLRHELRTVRVQSRQTVLAMRATTGKELGAASSLLQLEVGAPAQLGVVRQLEAAELTGGGPGQERVVFQSDVRREGGRLHVGEVGEKRPAFLAVPGVFEIPEVPEIPEVLRGS